MAGSKRGHLVVMDPKDLDAQFHKLGAIARSVTVAALKAIAEFAMKTYRDGIRQNSFGLEALSPTTLFARRVGKEPGKTPGRAPTGRKTPLYYSGTSMRNVRVARTGPLQFEVGIEPSITIAYTGRNARTNADFHERGGRARGKYTRRQLAFLHIVFSNRSSRGKRAREDAARRRRTTARVGLNYTRRIPSRPAMEATRLATRAYTKKRLAEARAQLQQLSGVRMTKGR